MSKAYSKLKHYRSGFTIVELLVVIVIIGVLATITVVSYTGISQKAIAASLQSDVANSAKKLQIFNVENGVYATSISCSLPDSSTNLCLKSSGSNIYSYIPDNSTNPSGFYIEARNGNKCYSITDSSSPVPTCPLTIQIGTQVWMQYNMNVGVMIDTSIQQTNNSTVEKYCYNNNTANCTTHGGLYQWGEMVQYLNNSSNTSSPSPAFSGNVQGICPSGFHLPTDAEWKTMEMFLGMSQAQADGTGFRGTNQATQLKTGGTSGFNTTMAGVVHDGLSGSIDSASNTWTSSEFSTTNSYYRGFALLTAQLIRNNYAKTSGYSVRCLRN